jgi:hypothetical protein
MFTERDMRDQIHETLGGEDANFNITDIADEIQRTYGTVDVNTIPVSEYWAIVERHCI